MPHQLHCALTISSAYLVASLTSRTAFSRSIFAGSETLHPANVTCINVKVWNVGGYVLRVVTSDKRPAPPVCSDDATDTTITFPNDRWYNVSSDAILDFYCAGCGPFGDKRIVEYRNIPEGTHFECWGTYFSPVCAPMTA